MRLVSLIILGLALNGPVAAKDFTVNSPDIRKGHPQASLILAKSYGLGCDGQNRAPILHWSGAPAGTQSFLVTLYDKDAPTGVGFMHWVVANIPSDVEALKDGASLPRGAVETRTDMGAAGYVGICPPAGSTHEYIVTVRALSVARLPVDANTTPAIVGFMARNHILGSARLRFRYSR
ncbi:YbhB/YbcL family Raf kinase inhibitor-like protein [Asticcacaulis sp.]|uniref:YbhB/YbcL family Raf kinase inhibitor-like protein n=1 Tax=Asticcacaulis sp. TaxID=1872648 RepID=UPI003F7C71B3